MTQADYQALLPLIILAADSVAILLAVSFSGRRYLVSFIACVVGLAASLVSIAVAWPLAPHPVTALLTLDRLALFTIGLIVATSLVVAAMSFRYLQEREDERGEYFFLLVLGTLGGGVLAASAHFASFFLGLELLSVSLFTLIAYKRERTRGAEAGFMYLILAGVSSAFLLFGMALSYHSTGSLELSRMVQAASGPAPDPLALTGLGMMAVAIGFKLAVAPFHLWTPDIYDGAPVPVTGYVATVSKGAMAVLLLRFFAPAGIPSVGVFAWIFAVISGLTMFVGNLLALRETNIKRVLAYSSIAHLGYLLVAFLAGGEQAVRSVTFYLVAYFVSSLGAFAAITGYSTAERDADQVEDYRGLGLRNPWLGAGLTASLLSLAGLPLTAGFMGKLILFQAGEGALLWVLAVLLAVNSTISLFYYLKIVSTMYRPAAEPVAATSSGEPGGPGAGMAPAGSGSPHAAPAKSSTPAPIPTGLRGRIPVLVSIALLVVTLLVLAIGIYPSPLLGLLETLLAPV